MNPLGLESGNPRASERDRNRRSKSSEIYLYKYQWLPLNEIVDTIKAHSAQTVMNRLKLLLNKLPDTLQLVLWDLFRFDCLFRNDNLILPVVDLIRWNIVLCFGLNQSIINGDREIISRV